MIAAQLISLRNSQRDYKFQDTQLRISVEPLLEAHLLERPFHIGFEMALV